MNPPGPSEPPRTSAAPPLPPRPAGDPTVSHVPYNGGMYGAGMGYGNPMGGGVYGGYGGGAGMYNNPMYGGMMGGGYGYGTNGAGGYGMDGNFSRLAEESSRGAFQSIESVVNAVNSVANMLSSTHNAVYSSFRAVIGVVDQFSRLKVQFTSLLASLALVRALQRLWRLLLVFLRLKPANYASAAELAWTQTQLPMGADVLSAGPSPPVNWPALLFWLVAIGGPWLIYKCVSRMVENVQEERKWANGRGAHYRAQALFDFQPQNDNELSFMTGDNLRIAPKEQQPRVRGWLLASSAEGDRIGLVPINYVKIVGKQSDSPPPEGQSIPAIDKFEKAFPVQRNN